MFLNSLVQEALLPLIQRLLIELLCDLVPELLNETNAIIGRKLSEGFDDLLRIHLHVTPGRDGTADDGGGSPSVWPPVCAGGRWVRIEGDGPRPGAGGCG